MNHLSFLRRLNILGIAIALGFVCFEAFCIIVTPDTIFHTCLLVIDLLWLCYFAVEFQRSRKSKVHSESERA